MGRGGCSCLYTSPTLQLVTIVHLLHEKTYSKFYFPFQPQNTNIIFQCKHSLKPNYVADENGHVHLVTYQENKDEDASRCSARVRTCCTGCSQSTGSARNDLSALTNRCCRFMFPASFAIFNLIYWLALSTGS